MYDVCTIRSLVVKLDSPNNAFALETSLFA